MEDLVTITGAALCCCRKEAVVTVTGVAFCYCQEDLVSVSASSIKTKLQVAIDSD